MGFGKEAAHKIHEIECGLDVIKMISASFATDTTDLTASNALDYVVGSMTAGISELVRILGIDMYENLMAD